MTRKLCCNCNGQGSFPSTRFANGGECPKCRGTGQEDLPDFPTQRGTSP